MAVKQSVVLRAKDKNAKYKLKYTYAQTATTTEDKTIIKYSYSKLITALNTKKYAYTM